MPSVSKKYLLAIKKTEKFIHKLDPDFIEIHIAMPYYGTELYKYCLDYNTLSDLAWGNDYYAPNTIGTSSVSLDEVIKIKKQMQLRFDQLLQALQDKYQR